MEAGLQPDRVTFNTLLKACMRSNLVDKALQLFDQMRSLRIPVSAPSLVTHQCTLLAESRIICALNSTGILLFHSLSLPMCLQCVICA